LDDKRINQFIEWFGTSVETDDCDPTLYMMNYIFDRFEFNLEQKYWMCWLYANTYNFATAFVIWNEFPDFHLVDMDRLKDWNNKNYKRLRYQVDTNWNKGHFPQMFESYRDWVGEGSQHDKFQSLLTDQPADNFDILWKEAKSWWKFGRYMAWFYLQTLKHCAGVPMEPSSLMFSDYEGSKSHRNGFCYAIGKDELVNVKLRVQQVIEFHNRGEDILTVTKQEYPHLINKVDYFAMETALCSFKKLFRTTEGRYMGYYHDRQAQEIKQVEKDGWIGINWTPLWQCRQENIDPKYLGGKIDKEKMKLYLKENPQKPTLNIIAGLPVTGKTTLMRQIRDKLNFLPKCLVHGLLRYEDYPNHVIFGIYDGETFDGTDKLSMAVNKDALEFLKTNKKKVLIEGDRLFNKKFLEGAESLGYDVKVTVLFTTSLPELLKRYRQRGKMQSPKFIKGRQTKLNNIRQLFSCTSVDSTHPLKDNIIQQLL